MTLKFLFIVDSFPPLNNQSSLRALEISKRLSKESKRPLILTRRVQKRQPKDYSLLKLIPKEIEIYKTPIIELKKRYSLKTLFFKIMAKILNIYYFIHWIPFGYFTGKKLLKIKKDIKFIYSTGPIFYSHIIAYLLKKKFNIPLIIEYRDPWNFSPYGTSSKINFLNNLIYSKIEKRTINSADIIITVSDPLILFLKRVFPHIKDKPIYSIPNGLNLKPISKPIKSNKEKIIFTFIGQLYGKRNIFPLLIILSILKNNDFFKERKFLLKIYGNYDKNLIKKKLKEFQIQDYVFLGEFLTRERIFEEINKCNLALHIGENLNYPTIGFKVWDYLSARKKILYLGREDSYTANFIKKNNFGCTIPINNMQKGIEIFKNLVIEIEKNKFDTIIDEKFLKKFSWDNKAKKFMEIIKNNNLI
ncbi:MAG: glycosyltransferase [Promethearchaeota archaeon]